jgi:WD40 repeat protein
MHGSVEAWTVAISPDSSTIATGSHAGVVNLFSIQTGERIAQCVAKTKFIMSVCYARAVP